MKYLKITLTIFIVTFALVTVSANAINDNPVVVAINDITIPTLRKTWTSEQFLKYNNTTQFVTETDCIDKVSGDGRAIEGNAISLLHGVGSTGFKELPKGKKIDMGEVSKNMGNWKLQLRSKKSFVTTASFWGIWLVD